MNIFFCVEEISSLTLKEKFAIAANVGTILAVIVAGITLLINSRNIRKQTKSSTMMQCLEKYLKVSEYKYKAKVSGEKAEVEQYWTALLDLHWTEYYLWNKKYVEQDAMVSWLYNRHEDFVNPKGIEYWKEKGEKMAASKELRYKDHWEELIKDQYFVPGDSFIPFMDNVHHSEEYLMKIKPGGDNEQSLGKKRNIIGDQKREIIKKAIKQILKDDKKALKS